MRPLLQCKLLFWYTSLIAPNPHPHQARIEADGNIVLPADGDLSSPERVEMKSTELRIESQAQWHLIEDGPLNPHVAGIRKWTHEALTEEWQEIEATAES